MPLRRRRPVVGCAEGRGAPRISLEALEPRVLLSASVTDLTQIGPALAYTRQPNAPITELEVSNDGQTAAFISAATNIGPAGSSSNLYLYDLVTNSVLFDTAAIDFDLNADGNVLAYSYQIALFNEQNQVFENRVTIDIISGSNPITDLLSELNTNEGANFTSVLNPSISGDGSRIVFEARKQEPTEQNPSPLHEVYLYDLVQQQLVKITEPYIGPEADGSSFSPVISADGQWVAFRSEAQNLLDAGYGVADAHIFLYDVSSGFITQRLSPTQYFAINNTLYDVLNVSEPSISDDGNIIAFGLTLDSGPAPVVYFNQSFQHLNTATITQSETEGSGTGVTVSGDGLFVGFLSSDSNLIFEDMNFATDAFVFKISSGETSRVNGREDNIESFATSTVVALADGLAFFVSDESDIAINAPFTQALFGVTELIDFVTTGYLLPPLNQPDDHTYYRTFLSGDGQVVSFASAATNLVAFDRNGLEDLFVVDRQSGVIERANLASSEEFFPTLAFGGAMSDDGRYVVFRDYANLMSGASSPFRTDIFLIDRDSPGYVERISVDDEGVQANGNSLNSDISSDGRYVAFDSVASNLIFGEDNNGVSDVFVTDRQFGLVERVSVSSSNGQANAASKLVSISPDGRFVLFSSLANNLVLDDSNGVEDLFLRDRDSGITYLVSLTDGGSLIGQATSIGAMSDDGRYIAFQSSASEIVPGDSNNRFDVFVLDRFTNLVERVSVDDQGQQVNADSYSPTLSPDGRFVAFISNASLTGQGPGLFIRDRSDDTLTYVGTAAGTQPSFSADMSTIAFTSFDNLAQGDSNGKADAYVASFNAGPAGNTGIQGQVFVDLNSNQEPDGIETVNQVQVYLDLDNDGTPDEGEPTINTDANGGFNFTGLEPGLYILRAIPPAGYQSNVEPTSVVLDFGDEAVVNIPILPVFRDATLSIEPGSIVEGGITATVTVTLDQASVAPITITLGFAGPALLDEDFAVTQQQLVIAPGQLSATAEITALTDGLTETAETFDVFISDLSYANDTADGEPVTVSIVDGASLPTVTLSAQPLSIQEGQASLVTATLSQITDVEVQVFLSVGGNVTSGDYQLSSSTITILAGELTGTVTLTANVDSETESLEMVGIAIAEADGALEDGEQEVFIDILDAGVNLPDLLVDIQIDRDLTLQPLQKTTIPVRVSNGGDLASSGGRVLLVLSTDDTLDDGDTALGSANLPGIQPDNFASLNVAVTMPAIVADGDYFVLAIVDPDDVVTESDEDNNTDAYAATVEFVFGEDGAGKGGGFNFTDDDGTNTTFKLTGGGTGQIILDNGFIDLLLNNTTPNSALKITTKNSGQQGDDGLIIIRNIIVNGTNVSAAEARTLLAGKGGKSVAPAADEAATLGKLLAKTTRLIGNLDADSGLKSIDLNQADGAVMNIGPTGNPAETLTLKLVQASNLTINSQMPIKSLTTTRWIDDDQTPDVLTAPSLGAMKITGNKALNLAGDFQADLVLTSAGDATLAATIAGTLSGSTWTVTGGAKSLKLANADTAALSFTGNVGAVSAAAWTSGSLQAATLKSLRTTGAMGADLTLTSNAASALGGARLGGAWSGTWNLAGGAGAITAPSISNLTLRSAAGITSISTTTVTDSRILLGVDGMLDTLPTQADDFTNPAAVLGSFTVSGAGASFVRNLVAAPTINTVSLREVDTSGDTELGLAALLMNSVTRTVNGASVRLTGLDTPAESVQDGAFVLRIVDDEPPVEG
jgi:hypothetical protein